MPDLFLVCAAFNNSSVAWSQRTRDEVASFEPLETQSWPCRDGAPGALPVYAGMAGALPAGVAAADVWVPFPGGVATFVRPGGGRIEPTATPAVPATSTPLFYVRPTLPN
jgi:hypothetical protein